jgi:glycerol uptake facilitator-like aquaporin
LLEIDIDCDGLHVVKRILFIKWKTKVTLVVNAWAFDMSPAIFILFNIVMCRSHLNPGVTMVHVIRLKEPLLFIFKLLVDGSIPEPV